jgi:hypothetical protein
MIIYNVTVKINKDKTEEWLLWMRLHHIPDVLNTGYFTKCRISILDLDEEDGNTYALQYDCPSMEQLNKYMMLCAPELQKKHIEKFAGSFVAFRTILRVVEEIYPQVSVN